MNSITKNNTFSTLNSVCYFFLFYISLVTFGALFSSTTSPPRDYIVHFNIVQDVLQGKFHSVHNFFHLLIAFFSLIFNGDVAVTALFILSFFVLCNFYLVQKYFTDNDNMNNDLIIAGATLALLFSSPIHIPFFHGNHMLLGKISNNFWHNPTLIALKPFALLTYFYFLRLLDSSSSKKDQILINIFLLVSIWAKPNFALFFMPASFIILMIDKDIQWRDKVLLAIKIYSLATILLMIQLYYQIKLDQGDNKFFIVFGDVWYRYAKSITLNITCSLLFVILVFTSNIKMLNKRDVQLAITGMLIAILQFYFLAESGDRMHDGNWAWGLQVSSLFIWIVALSEYIKEFTNRSKFVNLILSLSLLMHVATGVFYVFRIITKGLFY